MMNNTAYSDNKINASEVQRRVQAQLPPKWRVSLDQRGVQRGPDAALTVVSPDGRSTNLLVDIKRRLEPAAVTRVLEQMQSWVVSEDMARPAYLVAAGYLGERTRDRLRERNVNYLDLTGNTYVCLDEPGIYVFTQGASKDPDRASRPTRSLKGVKAGQIVRTLLDVSPPLGVRQIAELADTDPGNVSRLLEMLQREGLIDRSARGGVQEVRWEDLLKAWSQDYSVTGSNRYHSYLDPRGLQNMVSRLRNLPEAKRYAVTGSLAASRIAPVAPPKLGVVYVEDAVAVAGELGLVPAEAGSNVLLVEPKGEFVFERTRVEDGLRYVAPSQAAVDLMTGSGRNPAEADEVIDWMRRNESEWRT